MEAQDDQENNGSSENGPSSSSSNTFKVKIKIPIRKLVKDEEKIKVDADGDEDLCKEDENKVREEKIDFFAKLKKEHICCECGKEFSSGKALGGHMSSAHVQANQRLEELRKWKKNFSQEKSSKLMKRFDDNDDDEDEDDFGDGVFDNHEMMKIICDLCGKDFPSKKSLFGHMRCHPDRDWRGMKPPSGSKKSAKNGGFRASFNDFDDDGDDANDRFDVLRDEEEEERSIDVNVAALSPPPLRIDLKDCVKSWGVTDRRGRSPLTKKRSVSGTCPDEEGVHLAAQQLLSLINGDNNNNNHNSEVICSSNSVSSAPKEASLSDLKDKPKRKAAVDDTEGAHCGETCSDSPVHKKRRREKVLVKLEPGKDPVPSPVIKKTPDVKYTCKICGKIFASHQALGGHRSSHNKFKITIENTIDHHQDQEIKARNQEDINTQVHAHQDVQLGNQEINNYNIIDQHGSNNNNAHKCEICDKIFPTGQALGGHQRSHWTNNQEESSGQNPSKVLDFDLNELPELPDLDDDYYR
ncbi:hypothetical protein T459_33162 [Capsicum annuum]|uniref:C2H2-type domain-containing protein n=1 Tax=Capsicum annuum TaxID=4072 RepID=A0A2G2XZR3_CAPAN|nr:uncharacterized protein LOC107846241 [Capsicum annuum]PHT62994.1 hypothetical protein T459_33162 [Capsicum annuum]